MSSPSVSVVVSSLSSSEEWPCERLVDEAIESRSEMARPLGMMTVGGGTEEVVAAEDSLERTLRLSDDDL